MSILNCFVVFFPIDLAKLALTIFRVVLCCGLFFCSSIYIITQIMHASKILVYICMVSCITYVALIIVIKPLIDPALITSLTL